MPNVSSNCAFHMRLLENSQLPGNEKNTILDVCMAMMLLNIYNSRIVIIHETRRAAFVQSCYCAYAPTIPRRGAAWATSSELRRSMRQHCLRLPVRSASPLLASGDS